MLERKRPKVSVIIKALNEEAHVAMAIESAIAALEGIDGEIILADSLSADRTIEIAKAYPIDIVSLHRLEDRSCGSGGQLGYQYSRGDYICLIDGDMRLYGGFLEAALRFLENNPVVAGAGGIVVEHEETNLEYVKRESSADPDRQPGRVTRLDGGGVYRRAAIESVGFFTDRNLHGAEEFDLGARLHARGWSLARIDQPAVDHFGHKGSAYRLLVRRVRSRYAFSSGEVLRAALGQKHFGFVIRQRGKVFGLWLAVHAWWLCLAAAPFVADTPQHLIAAVLGLLLLPVAVMAVRCRSVSLGIYSVVAWNAYALCFIPGLLRSRIDPARWIDSEQIKHAHEAARRLVGAR
jgi:glycosyltransferase involved in cell wall biosynthesis